jgi:hypothetical protein
MTPNYSIVTALLGHERSVDTIIEVINVINNLNSANVALILLV